MPTTLSKELRNQLAKVTAVARVRAESASRAALENLAVDEKDYRSHMSLEQRQLRNRLRARGRALGDSRDQSSGTQEIRHLTEATAYEHWHRLLFTRFLAENHLLQTDSEHGNVPITLQDCDELAPQFDARDGFDLACRFAARTLPGVFRSDDPVLELNLAINDEVELKKLLDSLPGQALTADDSLGWTYQFWQAQRKAEVNKSGKKIGGDEIAAVTQLFTEDYMVEFLLHNTLGAWWAGRIGPIQATTEEEARTKAALPRKEGLAVTWTYLRLIQDKKTNAWSPAAGTFSGWPNEAKEIKLLDPCMGSGHFLVFALPLIARMRMEEESLTVARAVHATLTDNIYGLEIDERCSEIAAFNAALTAWKLGGYQPLPSLHFACSGLSPYAAEKDWVALARDDERLKNGMAALYKLFKNAPVLGSLINPRAQGKTLLEADFHELEPLLEKALAQETKDDTKHEMAVTASGLAKVAEILAGQFTLIATNVPYLGREGHTDDMINFADGYARDASADLATLMLHRCLQFTKKTGMIGVVLPQNWWVGKTYTNFRKRVLTETSWRFAAVLGEEAWQAFGNRGPNTILLVIAGDTPGDDNAFSALDVSTKPGTPVVGPETKARALAGDTGTEELERLSKVIRIEQRQLSLNREARVSVAQVGNSPSLSKSVISGEGCSTGDNDRFLRSFWELLDLCGWLRYAGPGFEHWSYCDNSLVVLWENGKGELARSSQARIQNTDLWERSGILVGRVRGITATIFSGGCFSKGAVLVCPRYKADQLPIYAFLRSKNFEGLVRTIDPRVSAATSVLTDVPFDLEYWQKVAAETYPHGLPKPFSSDPTQWLFNGHPAGTDQPLHVAVARLLGYQWPRQTGSSFPDCPALGTDGLEKLADDDGIVCLPPINREQPAANRIRTMLAQALGQFDERSLIASAGKKGSKSITLEDWLREEFFEQHCDLFHSRPFIWHIWDGRKEGFHALVNYHKLDHSGLQKLTYSYLGDWIRQQEEDAKADKPGADLRLGAARVLQAELAKILEGDSPYDIFVRWKPLSEQAVGWNPDINDGVRMNIRPFATADILRKRVKIKWDKDRGKEPHRDKAEYPWFGCEGEPDPDKNLVPGKTHIGHRWNNVHLTLAAKG